jgi:hypothetical protein
MLEQLSRRAGWKSSMREAYFSTGGNEAREYPYLGHDQQIADQAANSEQLARLEKQRLAKIEGAIALPRSTRNMSTYARTWSV